VYPKHNKTQNLTGNVEYTKALFYDCFTFFFGLTPLSNLQFVLIALFDFRFISLWLDDLNHSSSVLALYGAETWTLRPVDQKHLESFEMWCWRRMEKISWTDHVRNEEVLLRVKE